MSNLTLPKFRGLSSYQIKLIAVVLIAKTLGCMLPLAAKKLKLDPALMASPLLATVCDTCVVLIYFNIATFIMGLGL